MRLTGKIVHQAGVSVAELETESDELQEKINALERSRLAPGQAEKAGLDSGNGNLRQTEP